MHPPPQRHREPVEPAQHPRRAAQLGDQTLGMEVGDPVGEALAQQDIQRHHEVQQERRTAGEQNLVGRRELAP